MSEIGSDKKQETVVEDLRRITDAIEALSHDIRAKALELTSEGQEDDKAAEVAPPTPNVDTEFHSSLCRIREALREALKILRAFV